MKPAALLALLACGIVGAHGPGYSEDAPAGPAAGFLETGKALAAKKDNGGAYDAFARALEKARVQDQKDAARDALLALPTPPAPPLSEKERAIVVARIDEERSRYLRDVASRLMDRKKLKGALRILEVIRGSLQEESTAKVIGDPKGAERREREVADIRVRIFGEMPPAERDEADALAAKHRADPERLVREAANLRKERKPLAARRVLQSLVLDPKAPAGPKDAARSDLEAIEREFLAALDPEERKATDDALACPVFGRLQAVPSREFVFIGDADLVARIPERSRHVLDLAYLALTDLAGAVPNPDGDRITVFFKELWDFPGGIGGGTCIDIGRADPKGRQAVLVSTGLYFHELSHCVLQPEPRFPGWIEGIANFGAAFCGEFLKQETDEWHSARGNLEAFRRDYLEREETYWRTAPYGPSAGWFLHWIAQYGARPGGGHDWIRYGRVLRSFQALDPRPETVHGLARCFGALLAREFGPRVWEDLRAQRFPCEEGTEVDLSLPDGKWSLEAHVARELAGLEGSPPEDRARRLDEAGVLRGWRVCGPFYATERGDGFAGLFPPEREVILGREYAGSKQVARWYAAGAQGPVEESPSGTVAARWAYPEDSVTYGFVEFEIPAAADAWAWVGTEHRWALWVDGRLVEKQEWEAGRFVPDRDRVPLRLEKGRHRLLFKVALGWSGPTFAVRVTDREGAGLPGMRLVPPEDHPWEAPHAAETKAFFRDDFVRNALGGNWTEGPGGFQVRNKAARGTDGKGGVPWRKYSVRPGFPQDPPSNQLTLDPKIAKRAGKDLRVEVDLEGSPKIALTLDAEEAPGGLTGWTVVVVPAGGDTADVRLERYDRLMYLATGVALSKRREHDLAVERRDGRITVALDGETALDRVSAPPLLRDGVRLCTWGGDPAIGRFEIRRFE